MLTTFIQEGDAIDYLSGGTIVAGDVVVMGDLVGVARVDIKPNQRGAVALTGVFEFPKAQGDTIGIGDQLYWNPYGRIVSLSSDYGDYKRLGHAVSYAASADTKVRVRLMSGFPEVPGL